MSKIITVMPKYFYSSFFNNLLVNRVLNSSIRPAHTDIKVPDFNHYRRNSLKRHNAKTHDSEDSRKCFTYIVSTIFATTALYATKAELIRYVAFIGPSADVLALGKLEINLQEIPEGRGVTFKWRGKPLFIRHRTPEEIRIVRAFPLSKLRDPEDDSARTKRPEFLIVIGVCTHLGCIPIHEAGDYGPGGYYCPCHGSHFDASGRARQGPAPTNLEVPPYSFPDENTVIVG